MFKSEFRDFWSIFSIVERFLELLRRIEEGIEGKHLEVRFLNSILDPMLILTCLIMKYMEIKA